MRCVCNVDSMGQRIRFCKAADGVGLAYAVHGRGPPLVKAANWVTHVEFDWESPLWRLWWDELGRDHTVIRYDERGCGLSDRNPDDLDLPAFVDDLSAVVDAAGVDRFVLLGVSQGAGVAIQYAVENPDRVSRLVLVGSYAKGRMRQEMTGEQMAEVELLQSIVRVGWGKSHPMFRQVFISMLAPGATEEQKDWFDELMRVSTEPEMAVRLRAAWAEIDVTDRLRECVAPALVVHARGDAAIPFEEGRLVASEIPNARFLPLNSDNHVLLPDEPAWTEFVTELHSFLGTGHGPPRMVDPLSPRELETLHLVADGLTNQAIAGRLYLSPRTVERHLSNIYVKLGLSGKSARAAAAAMLPQLESTNVD